MSNRRTHSSDSQSPFMCRLRSERGQMFALAAVGIAAMIGMGAFVLDVGVGFRQQRKAQSAADGSALAAAQLLPTSPSDALSAAGAVATQNLSDGTVTTTLSTTYVANDTAYSKADTQTSAFLSKIFGFTLFKESADARAIAGSYTGWSTGLAPWVTDKDSLKWGQIATFKVKPGDQASSGNFGGARLPVKQEDCDSASGGNDYRKLIGGSYGSCIVSLGNKLNAETGNLVGPTDGGLGDRGVIKGFDPYSILQEQPDGSYVLTTYDHPNLVVIPVIDQFVNGNSTSFTVIGFAWFIITDYTSTTVTGMFIGSSVPGGAQCATSSGTTSCPIGGYSPYGFKVIQLIK